MSTFNLAIAGCYPSTPTIEEQKSTCNWLENLAYEATLLQGQNLFPSFQRLHEALGVNLNKCKYPPSPEEINATVSNDISNLEPDCGKIIWCQFNARDSNEAGYRAYLRSNVTREQAENLFESPQLNGTDFLDDADSLWKPSTTEKIPARAYTGQWNLTQLCYLWKRPEVNIPSFYSY